MFVIAKDFFILSKEKSHSISDDFFFLTTLINNHLSLHVSTFLYLKAEIHKLKM